MKNKKIILNWFKRVLNWIKQDIKIFADLIWVINITTVILLIPFIFYNNMEQAIRVSGMFCQLCGLISVVMDLYGKSKVFKIVQNVKAKLKTFPKLKPKDIVVSINAASISLGASISGVTIGQAPITFDEKLKALEDKINQKLEIIKKNARITEKKQAELLKKERQNRIQGDKNTNNLIKSLNADNFFWALVGVAWIFLGIIFASIPLEISQLLK